MSTKPAEPDDDDDDHCTCGLDPESWPDTEDHELPPAKGGVVGDRKPRPKKEEAKD